MTSTVLNRPTAAPSHPAEPDRSSLIRTVATTAGLVVGGLGYFLTLLNWSMAGDLMIIAKTIKAVVTSHGAY